jgi:guanosine-3',5'-bis(diphosphate) 3'-pyrophosphohydrolase
MTADPQALLLDAVAFAAERHRDQRRKDADASPYINHPIALASLLKREGIDDIAVLCAALLHDTLEDTRTSFEELRERFGDAIASIVLEVSDDKGLPKAERKRLQVEHARAASPRAKLVKLADKICNVQDIVHAPPANWPVERRREYLRWAKEVVDELRGTHPALETIFDGVYAEGVQATR